MYSSRPPKIAATSPQPVPTGSIGIGIEMECLLRPRLPEYDAPSSVEGGRAHCIAIGIYGHRLLNSIRVSEAGVAQLVSKDDRTLAATLSAKIVQVLQGPEGKYTRDVPCLQRIAGSAGSRKFLTAD